MFIQFLILAIFQQYGTSMPIIPDTREALQSGPIIESQNIRTRFDIVWSCVSTLFICTWVAIHPNIPPRGEGHLGSLWRRIKLMLWTLLVPELILLWAYKQWAAARYIAEYFQDEGWKPIHGHFLIMGGFIYTDKRGERVLNFDRFRELLGFPLSQYQDDVSAAQITFPTISAEEIWDKARGDFLSKAIVILQSLWFIIQCIARSKQGLALTELELVTVALASLNGVMYFFWWDKPLGVNEPINLYARSKGHPEKIIEGGRAEHNRREQRINDSSKRSPVQRFIDIVSPLLKDFGTAFPSCWAPIYRQFFSMDVNQFLKDQRQKLHYYLPGVGYLWSLYLPIYWLVWIPFSALTLALLDIISTDHPESQSISSVPMFYAPTPSLDSLTLLLVVLPPTAIIFGALHCVGWNFHFPSHIEQRLWRIGSLAITLLPTILLLLVVFVYINRIIEKLCRISISELLTPADSSYMLQYIAIFFGVGSVIAYMAARLLLLTLAVISLRRQPESAFYAIKWANFLPHI